MSRKQTSPLFPLVVKLATGSVLLLSVACAKVTPPPGTSGTGNASGTGSGGRTGGGGNGAPGSGGGTISRDDAGLVSSDVNQTVCQMAEYKFVPQIPTVYVMVDRSGSMFDCLSTTLPEESCPNKADTSWTKLKDGILQVIDTLDADVRFGFASFTGTNPRFGGTCPILNKVAPKLNNYGEISTLYNSLPFQPTPAQAGTKFETPASESLRTVGAELMSDQSPGGKYILYITDGEPDYCGDGNSLCAPDGVVGALQKLKTQGITTIIFGIKSMIAQDLPMGVLEAFANAGAGEPTKVPLRRPDQTIEAIYDECFNSGVGAPADSGEGGWFREFMASGKMAARGQTIGTYAATAGPTLPYKPDVTNQMMLVNQLSQALSGVKSCSFDLNNLQGKALKVDLTMLSSVSVAVQGSKVAFDATNGWRMNTASELELVGSACSNWRMPQNTLIDIQVPCAAIIIQ